MQLSAVIFDMDGVLTATDEYHFHSWKKVSAEFELPFTRKDNEKLRGLTRRQSLDVLLAGRPVPEKQKQAMLEKKNAYFLESLEDAGPGDVLPGVLTLLLELRQQGIRVGVASSSKNVHPVLNQLGITGLIETIADGASVRNPKPAPDIFNYAAASLQVKPFECLVIEDSEAGVQAALEAGMCVIGLGPEARLRGAHALYPELTGVNLGDLRELYRSWRLTHKTEK